MSTELLASAGELDALAYGLAGTGFPGLSDSPLSAVEPAGRGALAHQLALPLTLRGILDVRGPQWSVEAAYRPLLAAVLEPDLAVRVHRRTAREAATVVLCARSGQVARHDCDSRGIHRLSWLPGTLADAVVAQLALPGTAGEAVPATAETLAATAGTPPAAATAAGPVRLRYRALLRELDRADPADHGSFVAALIEPTYQARLTWLSHRAGSYGEHSLTVLAVDAGPLWTVAVEPDGEPGGDDGWLIATPRDPDGCMTFIRDETGG